MMRSWTVPLSSWRWASAAFCMGMDWCARRRSRPVGQPGDRLIQGAGSTVGRGLGERDAKVSGGRVRQGDHPLRPARQGDRVGQDALACRVEHGVHRAQRADPVGHARAVPHRRGSQLAGERFVVLADRADHRDSPGDRELRRDDANRPAAAEQQQRLPAGDVQLPQDTDGRLAELGSAAVSSHETVSGLLVQIEATAYST